MRLVASYHGLYDKSDVMRCRFQMCEIYEIAALPIDKGGMALRNVGIIFLTAFACSMAFLLLFFESCERRMLYL